MIIPYKLVNGKMVLVAEPEMEQRFPHTYEYLLLNKATLRSRERNRMRGPNWYAYVYPKNLDVMTRRKILVPDIADGAAFAMDNDGDFALTSGYGIILKETVRESDRYILGLLNSRVSDFYLKRVSTPLRGGYFRYFTQYIEQLPIRSIDFADRKDKARHDRMVELVDAMLALHEKVATARTPHDRTTIERQIAATDQQIDTLVYELYGLTDEEIKIVDEAAEKR